ncbi:unnamed protein product [Ixodes pacificus]
MIPTPSTAPSRGASISRSPSKWSAPAASFAGSSRRVLVTTWTSASRAGPPKRGSKKNKSCRSPGSSVTSCRRRGSWKTPKSEHIFSGLTTALVGSPRSGFLTFCK